LILEVIERDPRELGYRSGSDVHVMLA
jgi:hypothetical protein